MSVDHAKIRQQFGRPIGSFQAIKHRCSDMFVALESARSATYYAAWAAQADPSRFADAAVVARLVWCEQVEFATGRTCRSTVASGSPGSTTLTCS